MNKDSLILSVEERIFNLFLSKTKEEVFIEKRIEPEKYLGFQYQLDKNGRVTIYSFVKTSDNEYNATPTVSFSYFSKVIVDLVDTYSNSRDVQIFWEINTNKGKFFLRDEEFKLNTQRYLQHNKVDRTNLIKLDFYFRELLERKDLFQSKKEKWTTELCYAFNEHLCIENGWTLIGKHITKEEGIVYTPIRDLRDEYRAEINLFNTNYTKEEINEIKSLYNLIPINQEEGEVYKILMCSAISNWFHRFLKSKLLNERKEIGLIGLKGNRKSFMGFNTFGLFGRIDIYDKKAFSRTSNSNADLKNLLPCALPVFIDEAPILMEADFVNRKKSKANGTRDYFTKNNTKQGKDYHYDGFYECYCANSSEIKGNDYDDKQFTYEPKKINLELIDKPKDLIKKIRNNFANNITPSSLKLGKYIFDEIIKIDPKEIFKDINIPLTREDKQFTNLIFGEKILDILGLLTKYELNKSLFLSTKLSTNTNVESDNDKIKHYVQTLIQVEENSYQILLSNFFQHFRENKRESNKFEFEGELENKFGSFYRKLQANGLMFRYLKNEDSFELVLTRKLLTSLKIIARRFHENFNYNSVENLIDLFPSYQEKPSSTIILESTSYKFKGKRGNSNWYSIPLYDIYEGLDLEEDETLSLNYDGNKEYTKEELENMTTNVLEVKK